RAPAAGLAHQAGCAGRHRPVERDHGVDRPGTARMVLGVCAVRGTEPGAAGSPVESALELGSSSGPGMTISIIVPTLNEADTITAAVESARRAVADCDIIVVDAGSVDGTAAVARRAGARVVQAAGSRSQVMNIGAAHAVGPVLL